MDLYTILQTLSNLEEGTMSSAETHSTGPKFTSYWKGTDAGTPGKKMVGSCEESAELDEEGSLEEELRSAWDEFLAEFGADATSAAGTGTTDQAKTAQDLANAQKNINTLKTTAGVNIPNVAQASQSAVKAADDPTAPMSTQDKTIAMGIGQQLQQALAKGDPGQVNQIASALQKVKSGT